MYPGPQVALMLFRARKVIMVVKDVIRVSALSTVNWGYLEHFLRLNKNHTYVLLNFIIIFSSLGCSQESDDS